MIIIRFLKNNFRFFIYMVGHCSPLIAHGEDGRIIPQQSEFEFKPISITPSGDGETYDGKFVIRNKGRGILRIGSNNEEGEKLMPSVFGSEYFEKDKWDEIYIATCGLPTSEFDLGPGMSSEFTVSLGNFREQSLPLLCRIKLEEIHSDSFVLNWDLDKKEGRFQQAKQRNLQKVRNLLIEAGFKKSMLEGDDFCDRLVKSMMNEAGQKQGESEQFDQFVGHITRGPIVTSKGLVELLFSSEKLDDRREVYSGWIVINPKMFSSRWFKQNFPKSISVVRRDNGASMEFTDETQPWTEESSIYVKIIYNPVGLEKPVDLVAARAVFVRIVGVLGTYLEPEKRVKEGTRINRKRGQ